MAYKKLKRVFVTGAGGTATRNFVRSLRMAPEKFHIIGADITPEHLWTSDTDEKLLLPSAYDPSYGKSLVRALKETNADFLHAQPDVEVAAISRIRDELPARIFLPNPDTILLGQDKWATYKTLLAAGVPVPESFIVERLSEIAEMLPKLQRSMSKKVWVRARRGAGSRAALPVTSVRQAEEWIHYWRMNKRLDSNDFMMCEYLGGEEFAFQSLWHAGRLVSSAARQRLEYLFGNIMPSGQTSTPALAKTVHSAIVNRISIAAIKAIDPKPNGVFCVDLKQDAKGTPRVTEINVGRFFTTSDFLSAAGANMPYWYLRLGFGEPLPKTKRTNAIPRNLYWIRGVDKGPVLSVGAPWQKLRRVVEP